MHGSARWGHVLNVEEAYLSSNQASIRSLFSGVGGNGNVDGHGGAAACWGQEHGSSLGVAATVDFPSSVDARRVTGGARIVPFAMSTCVVERREVVRQGPQAEHRVM